MDDLLGEFVHTKNHKSFHDILNTSVTPHASGSLLEDPVTHEGIILQEEDDFGDFQDSKASAQVPVGNMDTAVKTDAGYEDGEDLLSFKAAIPVTAVRRVCCPQPGTAMDYISDNILTLPESFFSELSHIPYTLRRRVLSDARTRLWIKGVVEGGRIGQRLVRGRRRKTKGASAQDKFAVDAAAQKLSSLWSSIVPRLTSLSTGLLKLKPLTLLSFNEDFVEAETCEICATEEEDDAPILRIAGLRGHQTCVALVQRIQTTRST